MKVILLGKVRGLGNMDDIKDVADGYARNFLFPQHLAVPASMQVMADLEAAKKRRAKEEAADLQRQQAVAERLDGLELEIKEKANEQGMLYAAVAPAKVAEALAKFGFNIDKERVVMRPPIKAVGEYPIKIKFRHGLEAEVKLTILGG